MREDTMSRKRQSISASFFKVIGPPSDIFPEVIAAKQKNVKVKLVRHAFDSDTGEPLRTIQAASDRTSLLTIRGVVSTVLTFPIQPDAAELLLGEASVRQLEASQLRFFATFRPSGRDQNPEPENFAPAEVEWTDKLPPLPGDLLQEWNRLKIEDSSARQVSRLAIWISPS